MFFFQNLGDSGMNDQQPNRTLSEWVCTMKSLIINGTIESKKPPDPEIINLCAFSEADGKHTLIHLHNQAWNISIAVSLKG